MSVENVHLSLPTESIERCLDFYVNGLLFKKEWESEESCVVCLDTFKISFFLTEERHVQAIRLASVSFGVTMSGIEDYFNRVQATGRVRFTQELELMQPGVWQFEVYDCNGYRVGFSMPTRLGVRTGDGGGVR